jgi:hypothetical protein
MGKMGHTSIYKILVDKQMKDIILEACADGREILNLILREYDARIWTGFNCLVTFSINTLL